VARVLTAGLGRVRARMSVERANVNGGPALIVRLDGRVDGVLALRVEARRVSGIYYVRNPQKLSWLDEETLAAPTRSARSVFQAVTTIGHEASHGEPITTEEPR
jgi:hypothetical protein